MTTSVALKDILLAIVIITLIGVLLHSFSGVEKIHIPNTLEIGNKSSLLFGLIIIYFILSFAILYLFFQPKTPQGTAAVIGGSLLWSIY